jgi:DNA polymerase I-like protein with 3'-5' exonuclease and polymerase domains
MHYMFDEQPGTHGLKTLAMKHTPYGDYEKPLQDFSEQYRKQHGILKESFSYEMIPFDVMKVYAAMDAVVTFLLYQKMRAAIRKTRNCCMYMKICFSLVVNF